VAQDGPHLRSASPGAALCRAHEGFETRSLTRNRPSLAR
jgi:hypothetical protein